MFIPKSSISGLINLFNKKLQFFIKSINFLLKSLEKLGQNHFKSFELGFYSEYIDVSSAHSD